MFGAGRVAVSKAFASLREVGAVEQRDRLVHIADLEALEHAAEALALAFLVRGVGF
jgi:hypothetical protein